MDNKELTAAASAFIQWCNSQEISPANAEKMMYKTLAKIICDRLKIGDRYVDPASQEEFKQEMLRSQEHLIHELISRIYTIRGRK